MNKFLMVVVLVVLSMSLVGCNNSTGDAQKKEIENNIYSKIVENGSFAFGGETYEVKLQPKNSSKDEIYQQVYHTRQNKCAPDANSTVK